MHSPIFDLVQNLRYINTHAYFTILKLLNEKQMEDLQYCLIFFYSALKKS